MSGANSAVYYTPKKTINPTPTPVKPKVVNTGPRPILSNVVFPTGFEYLSNFDPIEFPNFQPLSGANSAVYYTPKKTINPTPTPVKPKVVNTGPRPILSNVVFPTGFEYLSNFDPIEFPNFQPLSGANSAVYYTPKKTINPTPTPVKPKVVNTGPRPILSNVVFPTGFEYLSNFDPIEFPNFQPLSGANSAVYYTPPKKTINPTPTPVKPKVVNTGPRPILSNVVFPTGFEYLSNFDPIEFPNFQPLSGANSAVYYTPPKKTINPTPAPVPVPIYNGNELLYYLSQPNVTYLQLQNNVTIPASSTLTANGSKVITSAGPYKILKI